MIIFDLRYVIYAPSANREWNRKSQIANRKLNVFEAAEGPGHAGEVLFDGEAA
jgi:hypothetical protein